MKKQIKNGFTLIELLVVVLIIGVLTAIAAPRYEMAVEKSRMVEAQSNIKVLLEAANRHYIATGVFPTYIADLDVGIPGTVTGASVLTKYFTYTLFSNATYFSVLAYRNVSSGNSPYHIYIDGSLPSPLFRKKLKCTTPANGNSTEVQQTLCAQIVANGSI